MGQYEYVDAERSILKKEGNKLECAFKQLAQGKYPSQKEETPNRNLSNPFDYKSDCNNKLDDYDEISRGMPEKVFEDMKKPMYSQAMAPPLNDFHNILGVESVRQKVYLDDKWRKVTKTEHIGES